MFVIMDDAGRYTSLNVWLRRSVEQFTPQKLELKIRGVDVKRVALVFLQKFPTRILQVESPGGKGVWLFVAVEVSEVECEAIRALAKAEKLTRRDAEKLVEEPTAEHVLKHLALRKIVT